MSAGVPVLAAVVAAGLVVAAVAVASEPLQADSLLQERADTSTRDSPRADPSREEAFLRAAQQRYDDLHACLAGRGYQMTRTADGGYNIRLKGSQQQFAADEQACGAHAAPPPAAVAQAPNY